MINPVIPHLLSCFSLIFSIIRPNSNIIKVRFVIHNIKLSFSNFSTLAHTFSQRAQVSTGTLAHESHVLLIFIVVLILLVYITYLTSQKFILFMTMSSLISKDDLSSILPRHVSGLLLSHQYHVISHTVNVMLLHIQVFNTVNCQLPLFSQASSMLVFVNDQVKLASCMSSFSITLHRFIVAPPSFRSTWWWYQLNFIFLLSHFGNDIVEITASLGTTFFQILDSACQFHFTKSSCFTTIKLIVRIESQEN